MNENGGVGEDGVGYGRGQREQWTMVIGPEFREEDDGEVGLKIRAFVFERWWRLSGECSW